MNAAFFVLAVLLSAPVPAPDPAPAPAVGVIQTELLTRTLRRHRAKYRAIWADPGRYRAQVLVSIPRRTNGELVLERHGWRVDAEYFYPASALKTAAAVAALQRLEGLQAQHPGLSLDTPLAFSPQFEGERLETLDATNIEGGVVTLGHLIRRMSLVSSNHAFNRLYDFAGHEGLNRSVQAAGLTQTSFHHRLSAVHTLEENRRTPRVELRPKRGQTVVLPEALSPLRLAATTGRGVRAGLRYKDPVDRHVVEAPFDFAWKNRMSLRDLQDMLVMVTRPDIEIGRPGYTLKRAHRRFLKRSMLERPGQSVNPVLPETRYNPLRFKPCLTGLLRLAPLARWRVWSKAGKAYGFRIENAYIVDHKTRRSMFLTVVTYTNRNGTVNDGTYQYDTVADPFIAEVTALMAKRFLAP